MYQKKVSRAGTSNYIPHILWDVITCPCPWYMLQAYLSSHKLIDIPGWDHALQCRTIIIIKRFRCYQVTANKIYFGQIQRTNDSYISQHVSWKPIYYIYHDQLPHWNPMPWNKDCALGWSFHFSYFFHNDPFDNNLALTYHETKLPGTGDKPLPKPMEAHLDGTYICVPPGLNIFRAV